MGQIGEKDGVVVIGTVHEVGPVRYGKRKPELEGQPVQGLFAADLNCGGALGYRQRVTFNGFDRKSMERDPVYDQLMDPQVIGQRVAIRCEASANESGYVNLKALEVVSVPSVAPYVPGVVAPPVGSPVGAPAGASTGEEAA